MIETQATVVGVEGSFAYVTVSKATACGACSADGESCGTSTLARFFARRAPVYRVSNSVGAHVGERVVVGVEEGALLKGSLAVYLSPLVFVVLGAMGASLLSPSPASAELYSIAGAAVGLGAGFVWLKVYSRLTAASPQFQPVILRKDSASNKVFNISEV